MWSSRKCIDTTKCRDACPPFPQIAGVRFALIPGFFGYAVSSDGKAWSCRNRGGQGNWSAEWRQLAAHPNPEGYPCVKLCRGSGWRTRKNVTLHKMILLAFAGPCPPGMEACHYPDPDRTNCALGNLHWGTRKANVDQRREHGNGNIGEQNPMAKLSNDDVADIRSLLAKGESDNVIAGKYGVSRTAIWEIRSGRTWSLVA
jgi:hypothetical protein